jgi:phosphate transport system substrate-binding protein
MRSIVVALVLVTLGSAWGVRASAEDERILIGGSTTIRPIMVAVIDAFRAAHPGIDIELVSGGSEVGVEQAAAGKFTIGMCSRALMDAERKAHPDLVETRIASDGLVLVAPVSASAAALTSAQVVGIYTGAITNWKQVGGADLPIVPIGRDQSHGAASVFDAYFKLESTQEFLGALAMIHERVAGSATPGAVAVLVTSTNADSITAVADHPGGLVYCSASTAEDAIAQHASLRILSLDGVAGSSATIRDGTYPLCRPLMLLTRGQPRGTARDIIDFALSPEGQKLVEKANFLPLAAARP